MNADPIASNSEDTILIYGLDDRPSFAKTMLAAFAHLFAIVVSIMTAPLIIARGIGLDSEMTAYIINASLVVSGIATFIQVRRFGPIGSGLLSVQGTSFSYSGAMIAAAALLQTSSVTDEQVLGTLLGTAVVGAALVMILGTVIEYLQRVITLRVAGIAIILLGLTLVGTSVKNVVNIEGGLDRFAQAGLVIVLILATTLSGIPWLRLLGVSISLLVGMLCAWFWGHQYAAPEISMGLMLLRPMPFELGFDFVVLLLLMPVFLVTMTESVGDLTATASLSRQPISGPPYWLRIKGGVIGDGFNSIIAAFFGSFPNTTFSQNNGIIRLTGVASRYVGYFVAAMLIALGTVPAIGQLFQIIPGGVLYGATALMFFLITVTGWRILQGEEGAMSMLLVCSLISVALYFLPDVASGYGIYLAAELEMILKFPVATGALCAIVWECLLIFRFRNVHDKAVNR